MVRIKVSANLALFQRPELTQDKCSYEMITPSAARGVMESIYWHNGMKWIIDRIYVLNPIKMVDLGTRKAFSIIALRDVSYIIEAHFEMTDKANASDNPGKFADIIRRRLEDKKYYRQPYLGSIEYPAEIEVWRSRSIKTAYKGIRSLGFMLYDFDYSFPDPQPIFFHVLLKEGVLDLGREIKTLR